MTNITIVIISITQYVTGAVFPPLGPIPMMIGSELFRQGPRPLVMATAGVVNWVTTFIVAMTFEHIQVRHFRSNCHFVLWLFRRCFSTSVLRRTAKGIVFCT